MPCPYEPDDEIELETSNRERGDYELGVSLVGGDFFLDGAFFFLASAFGVDASVGVS